MGDDTEYAEEIRSNLSCFPVWEPGDKISPGDIGVLKKGGIFARETSLANEFPSLRFNLLSDNEPKERHFVSQDCTVDRGQGGAELKPGGKASASITFHKEGTVIYDFLRCTRRYIDDLAAVGDHISKHKDAWPRNMVLVSQVESARRFAVLVSQSKDWTVDLSGSAEPIRGLQVAHASVTIATREGSGYKTSGRGPVTARLFGYTFFGSRPTELMGPGRKAPRRTGLEEISARDPSI